MTPKKVLLTRPVRRSCDEEKKEGNGGVFSPLYGGGEEKTLSTQMVGPSTKSEAEKEKPLQRALHLVGELTDSDLKTLYDHIALALNERNTKGGAQDRDLSLWVTAVYDALTHANGGSPAGMPGPLVFKRLLGARSSWPYIADFLAVLGGETMRPAERLSILRLVAKLLVERCHTISVHARIPLTAKLVANNCAEVAAVFENSFPGYVGAGLVPLLLRRLLAGGTHVE